MHTNTRLKTLDVVNIGNYDSYLRSKGLNDQAISYFQSLKYLQQGSREQKVFELGRSFAHLNWIALAVHRVNQNELKMSLVWI